MAETHTDSSDAARSSDRGLRSAIEGGPAEGPASGPNLTKDAPDESSGEVIYPGSGNPRTTKVLLLAGIVAAGAYVVGDLQSGLIYDSSRPYSFKDQLISELSALGSPVRPLMVAVATVYCLLLGALAVGVWRAAGKNRNLRGIGLLLLATAAVSLVLHAFFPMTSRWMEPRSTDTMHEALSIVFVLIVLMAFALSAVAYRGWFRVYSIVTILVTIGFVAAASIAGEGIHQNDTPWAGAFERIDTYVLMAWVVVLAVTLMRRSLSEATPATRAVESVI